MASSRIAGITIEIGGDTTGLNKALKSVDSQLSTTQKTLKDVKNLLKFDPGNTELLTQKQKGLQDSIKATQDRLKQLKSTQTDALSTEQYDALQREIIATEQSLESLTDEYREFGSVGAQKLMAVGGQISEVGQNVTNLGKDVTKHVTAPIAAVGTAAYLAFTEVDEGMDTIIVKTGATGEALDEMGGIMQEIATEIPVSFAEAGEAVGEVNTRFGAQGEELKGLSEQYLMFAKLNDTNITNAVDASQKALAAFGESADDASGYLDTLTQVSQDTGISVESLMNGAVKNSTAFQELGMSLDDATVFMGNLETSGADSSAVMNGLSKALKNATKNGQPLDEALAELQDTIKNGTDTTDGLTEAYELFGTSGAQVFQMVRDGQIDFTNLAGAATDASGTVVDTFNATLDPADSFVTTMNALKETGAAIAETVMPLLSDILGTVRDKVLELKAQWDGLDESQKQNILKIVGIIAAIGPLLIGLGTVIDKVGSTVTTVGNLTKAFSNMSPKARIIGLVVAAAAALVIKHWDEIKAFYETTLKPKLEDLKQVIVEDVVPKVKEAWEAFSAKAKQVFEAVKGFWNNTLKPALEAMRKWIKDDFLPGVQKAWDNFKPKIEAVFKAIKGFWEKTLKPVLDAMWKWIKNDFLPAVQQAWEDFQPKIEAVFDAIKGFWADTLKPTFEDIWTFVTDSVIPAITEAWETIGPVIEDVFDGVSTWWDNTGKGIFETIASVAEEVVDRIGGYFDGLLLFITSVFSGDWKEAWEGVKKMFGSIFKGLPELLKNPINNIISGLNAMIGKVETAVNAIVNAINKHVRIKIEPIYVFGAKVFDGLNWGAQLKGVQFNRLKYLAQGGVLGEGQRAVVGEYAPEYLTVRNGQAVVAPIPSAQRQVGDNITLNVYAQPGQDARAIAREAISILTREQQQRSAAYA